ncbi:TlpA family protein disulfide reductase (plasmid) [Coraliomargarita sp. W4R53]
MNLVDAIIVIVALLALTAAVGAVAVWARSRPMRDIPHEVVEPQRLGAQALGETATLLQFSTAAGSRCPDVHATLARVAEQHDGVCHLDIDLTHRPDIAKHFHVLQTPTTLVLDCDGVVRTRFGGIPSQHVIELELTSLRTGASFEQPDAGSSISIAEIESHG